MATRNELLDRIRIMRTIEMFANQEGFIRDNIDRLTRAIEQSTREIELFIMGRHPIHGRLISDLRERLASTRPASGTWSDQRMLNILDAIDSISSEISRITGQEIITSSSEIFHDVYSNYPDILSFDGDLPIRFDTLSSSQIRSFVTTTRVGGRGLREFVNRIFTNSMQEDLRNEFLVAAFQGEGIPKITRRIRQQFDWLDDTQINRITQRLVRRGFEPGTSAFTRAAGRLQARQIRHNVITAARTHMQTVANEAMENIFSENEDIIKGYEWNATMEPGYSSTGRGTCPRCAGLDGQVYDVNEERPPIPLHPNCRCIYTPITKDWRELGIDAEEVIGRNRAEVIRETDAQIARGRGRAIGAGGRKILGPVNRAGARGSRTYSEWYEDRGSLFKVNLVGPSRANWIENSSRRSLNDIVDKNTGELILLEDLPGSSPVVTREEFVEDHGTSREKRLFKRANN